MRTRPDGAGHRIRTTLASEVEVVDGWVERRFRVALRRFVDACARLEDHDVKTLLRRFAAADELSCVEGQRRTTSAFETRSLECLEQIRPLAVRLLSEGTDESQWQTIVDAVGATVRSALLGSVDDTELFDVVCWNEANCVAESVQRPYLAANLIRLEAGHEPVDRFGLGAPMLELAIRYEDVPEERESTAADIVRVLDDFRARAPWPTD